MRAANANGCFAMYVGDGNFTEFKTVVIRTVVSFVANFNLGKFVWFNPTGPQCRAINGFKLFELSF